MNNKKNIIPMYILFVYKKELSKNEYLKTLLITSVKSLKKIIKIIWTDKKVTMACALSNVMSMSDILAALL